MSPLPISLLGSLRQQAGVLDGKLQAVTVAKEQLSTELDELRRTASDAHAQASALKVEADQWKERTERAEKALAKRQTPPKPKVRRAKTAGSSNF